MTLRKLSRKQFGIVLEQKASTENIMVAKTIPMSVEKVSDDDKRVIRFISSSSNVDRDNDTVSVKGWDLKGFKQNGPFLWAHNAGESNPPIGKAIAVKVENDLLKIDIEFLDPNFADHPWVKFSDMIYRMYQHGFMKDVSVGFLPLEFKMSEERDGFGVDFEKQELLELSAVPVGSNRDVGIEFIKAKDSGIDIDPAKEWIDQYIEEKVKAGVWMPKDKIEAVKKAMEQEAKETKPTTKGAISFNSAHPNGTPKAPEGAEWDGPNEVVQADVDDLKVMSAWVDSEEKENKTAYKLPHHKAGDDHSVVWNGVSAAMGALMGARGGVDIPDSDRKGVYNHLVKHYEEFDKVPPEFERSMDASEDLEGDKAVEGVTKAGRTLSNANESKLREAVKLLGEVLSKLDTQDEPKGCGCGCGEVEQKETPKAAKNIEPQETENQQPNPDIITFSSDEDMQNYIKSQVDVKTNNAINQLYEDVITPLTGKVR